jgi:predicted RNase H-like HicB family nuclease
MAAQLHIQARWDAEVEVWIATSDDVPGLDTESDTIEKLEAKMQILIPDLLEANGRHQDWSFVIEESEITCLD